jgi:hypothetical protein
MCRVQMPRLADISGVLTQYRTRYKYLDAFVDDVDEFSLSLPVPGLEVVRQVPRLVVVMPAGAQLVAMELYKKQGIARFWLATATGQGSVAPAAGGGAALGALLGAAIGSASSKKEGLLGGLILGMLAGGLVGAAVAPSAPERVLAMRFEPSTQEWVLYDGPLLRWAKKAIAPASE